MGGTLGSPRSASAKACYFSSPSRLCRGKNDTTITTRQCLPVLQQYRTIFALRACYFAAAAPH